MTPKIILSIAGSDCSGGAGIQADIKTISALGGYAASAITAVTAQNTTGVQSVFALPAEMVAAQICSMFDDLDVAAVKIGMVFDEAIVHAIAECLKKYRPTHVVFDPVMISTSGHKLIKDETIDAIKRELIPLASLITPNLHEARLLFDKDINSVEDMECAAAELSERYATSVLIKGGHLTGDIMCDVLCHNSEISRHSLPKIYSHNLHGTGCTLSSAIASLLAQGLPMPTAVSEAKLFVNRAIAAAKNLTIGHANGPLWHFHSQK